MCSCRLVIPAKAGIQLLPTHFLLSSHPKIDNMDSRFRGNDYSCHRIQRIDNMGSRFRGNDDFQPATALSQIEHPVRGATHYHHDRQ